jgi:hypothetical protein
MLRSPGALAAQRGARDAMLRCYAAMVLSGPHETPHFTGNSAQSPREPCLFTRFLTNLRAKRCKVTGLLADVCAKSRILRGVLHRARANRILRGIPRRLAGVGELPDSPTWSGGNEHNQNIRASTSITKRRAQTRTDSNRLSADTSRSNRLRANTSRSNRLHRREQIPTDSARPRADSTDSTDTNRFQQTPRDREQIQQTPQTRTDSNRLRTTASRFNRLHRHEQIPTNPAQTRT